VHLHVCSIRSPNFGLVTALYDTSVLMDFVAPVGAAFAGVLDALAIHRALPFYFQSKKIVKRTAQCVLLNGVIFLGSMAFVDGVMLPLVRRIGSLAEPGWVRVGAT
jgi:hypothetical protein